MTFACRIGLVLALALGATQVARAQDSQVTMNAGAGGTLGYADRSVAELGGTLALKHASKTTTFRITPTIGYFVLRGVELSLLPDFTIIDVDGNTDVTLGVLLEPSLHFPFSERVFAFAALGFGLRYAKDPGVDFALRPKIGLDFVVGRSGIFKPALFLDFGTNNGLSQGGFEAGFTVML